MKELPIQPAAGDSFVWTGKEYIQFATCSENVVALLLQRNELFQLCKDSLKVFEAQGIYGATKHELKEAITKMEGR